MQSNNTKNVNKRVLTIIIPSYNEEQRLPGTLKAVLKHCDSRHLNYEIIVVDDGSSDRTIGLARKNGGKRTRLLHNKLNMGKGYSVRKGILSAKSGLILIMDSDMATPIGELDSLIASQKKGCDIVIGSRNLHGSRLYERKSLIRQSLGKIFPLFVRLIVLRGINDTQCGFKLFSSDAAKRLARLQRLDGFCFDVELLYLARKLNMRILEIPVEWHDKSGSKVRPVKDGLSMLKDLFIIRYNDFTNKYQL